MTEQDWAAHRAALQTTLTGVAATLRVCRDAASGDDGMMWRDEIAAALDHVGNAVGYLYSEELPYWLREKS